MQSLVILFVGSVIMGCGLLKSDPDPKGWWLATSAIQANQDTRISLDLTNSYMVGVSESTSQTYVLSGGNSSCDGDRRAITIEKKHFNVPRDSSKGCPSIEGDFDLSDSDTLVIKDVSIEGQLKLSEMKFQKISLERAKEIYRTVYLSRRSKGDGTSTTTPDGEPIVPSFTPPGTPPAAGVVKSLSDLEGFWQYSGMWAKDKIYTFGETLPNGSKLTSNVLVLHFKSSTLLQYLETYSLTSEYARLELQSPSIAIPEQTLPGGTHVAATRIHPFYFDPSAGWLITDADDGGFSFVAGLPSDYKIVFYRITEATAREALKNNSTFKKYFP